MIRKCIYCEHTFRVKAGSRQTRCHTQHCDREHDRDVKKAFREKHPAIWRERSRLAMQKMRANKRAAAMGETNTNLVSGSVEQQQQVKKTRSAAYIAREKARKAAYEKVRQDRKRAAKAQEVVNAGS